MKLGIVIPLKAKLVSRNWDITSMCLERTLRSVEAQTSENWDAIVVGHDKPDFLNNDTFKTRFSTIETPSPFPPRDAHRTVNWDWVKDRAHDRNRKIIRGMQLLSNKAIDYWYYLDGDDFIHRKFVESLSAIDLKAGAVLEHGYLWYSGLRRIIPHFDMVNLCGSTAILRNSDTEIPNDLDPKQYHNVAFCRDHRNYRQFFVESRGGEYVQIRTPLLAYSVGHGDNSSDGYRNTIIKRLKAWAKPYVRGRKIDPATAHDFCLAE